MITGKIVFTTFEPERKTTGVSQQQQTELEYTALYKIHDRTEYKPEIWVEPWLGKCADLKIKCN